MKTKRYYKNRVAELEMQLRVAQETVARLKEQADLKAILSRLTDVTLKNSFTIGENFYNDSIIFPDHVPVYVDDIFGGRVIKQEAIKVVIIDKDGNVKTGLTKEKADKGYSYKLVRE